MMWLFAVLVVLALGAIAVVAAGRGTPMEPAYDDRPDALVPAEGPIGADDLRRVRFSLAFRGYRMSEVDALLERLAEEREAERRRDRATGETTGQDVQTTPVASPDPAPDPAPDPSDPSDPSVTPDDAGTRHRPEL